VIAQTVIATLRAELNGQEEHYKLLLESRQPSADSTGPSIEYLDICDDPDHRNMGDSLLFQQYKQLTQLKNRLYTENDELHRMHTSRMIQEARLQQVQDLYGQVCHSHHCTGGVFDLA
jgi:hypothetical protein